MTSSFGNLGGVKKTIETAYDHCSAGGGGFKVP